MLDTISLLQQFVSMNTVSRFSNVLLAQYIANVMNDLGWQVKVYQYVSHETEKQTVYATLGPEPATLLLAGHMDTVPASPDWRGDPWQLIQTGNRLEGLGTTDMKCFLALMCQVANALKSEQLRSGIALAFTHDEEIGLLGAKRLIASLKHEGRLPQFAIAGEPTEMAPVYLHKGYMSYVATIRGIAGHSSNPARGVNSLHRAMKFMERLQAYGSILQRQWNPSFTVPFATINIGAIEAGKDLRPNIVPAVTQVAFDVRPLPGQEIGAIHQDILAILNTFDEYEFFADEPAQELHLAKRPTKPMETPVESLIVSLAAEVTGNTPRSVAFTTEGTVYSEAGIESIVLGPGSIEQAHTPQEFIDEKWLKSDQLLIELSRRFALERTEPLAINLGRYMATDRRVVPKSSLQHVQLRNVMTSPIDPKHITHILKYASRYRHALIVIKIEDDIRLPEILQELTLLHQSGMRVLCVINFSHHLRHLPTVTFQTGLPIIRHQEPSDQTSIYPPVLVTRLEHIRALIEATPPLGLIPFQAIQTTNHQLAPTGLRHEVVSINRSFIDPLLHGDRLPICLSLDDSSSHLVVSAEELAGVIACTYRANKLIFCSHQGGVFIDHGLQRQLTPQQLTTLIPQLTGQMQAAASIALKVVGQVPRVHLIPQQPSAILTEIFTEDGFGTLVYNDHYHEIRPATTADLPAIQLLHQQWSRPVVQFINNEEELKHVWVATREESVLGVAYLICNGDRQADVTLLVDRQHTGQGFGKGLINAIYQSVDNSEINQLLVRTPIAKDWYVHQGFIEQGTEGRFTLLTKQLR